MLTIAEIRAAHRAKAAQAECFSADDHETAQEKNTRRCDDLFQQAMMKAITGGRERATRMIFKDDTPFVGRMIHPEPFRSGMSSSAALCVEADTEHRAGSDTI